MEGLKPKEGMTQEAATARAVELLAPMSKEHPLVLATIKKMLSGEIKGPISEGVLVHVGGFDDPKPGELGATTSRM